MHKGAAFFVLVVVAVGLAAILVLGHDAPRNAIPLRRTANGGRIPRIPETPPRSPNVPPEATAAPGLAEQRPAASGAACPDDMRYVRGEHCTFVAHKCEGRASNAPVCERFVDEVLCEGSLFVRRFCIDRYEYPNQAGVLPATFVDFDEARAACDAEQKRLCTAPEWQLACEGPRRTPYVGGLTRDETCNTDRPDPKSELLGDPFEVTLELDRLDGRRASGGARGCDSAFGVADLGGNLSEWVENPEGGSKSPPFRASRAGGNFGAAPSTCRTLVTDVPGNRRSHRVGFRCCVDAAPNGEPSAMRQKRKPPSGFQKIGAAG